MPKFAFYCVILTIGFLLLTNFVHCEENTYDIKYDNINIDEINEILFGQNSNGILVIMICYFSFLQ